MTRQDRKVTEIQVCAALESITRIYKNQADDHKFLDDSYWRFHPTLTITSDLGCYARNVYPVLRSLEKKGQVIHRQDKFSGHHRWALA